MKEILTHNAQETRKLGRQIGAILVPKTVIAFTGELGAGKTTLIQGIAEGLGITEVVASPTFIIINEYTGRLSLYHFDLYRLDNVAQIEELGVEDYFARDGVCVVEWAEKLGTLLPVRAGKITLEVISEEERKICVSSALAAQLK